MTPDCRGSIPEERDQSPGIWACNDGYMRQRRQGADAPEGDVLVDEVSDQNDLSWPEMVPGPEEDPREDEEVVQNEMRRRVGCYSDNRYILGKELDQVPDLGEEEEDPARMLPICAGEEGRVCIER